MTLFNLHKKYFSKGKSHFLKIYEDYFFPFKNKKINILEIGSCRGTSVHLWQTYFPKAEIIGIDVWDQLLEKHLGLERVTYLEGDAYDVENAKTLPDFDIIIDDGSHHPYHQISCIEIYLSKLKEGGVLVIEDVAKFETFEELKKAVPDEYKSNVECLDLRENKGRSDDMMFIIRK
jgi:precorrin-6B methylase 2